MKNITFFLLIVAILFSACKNSENKSDSDTEVVIDEQTDENYNTSQDDGQFLSYKGKPTFDKFISFFEEKSVPFESHPYFGESIFTDVISKDFSDFTGVDVGEYKYILQMGKFQVNNNICLLFVTCDLEEIGSGFVCTYNKKGELIDSQEFDFYSFFGELTFFRVDKSNNVFIMDSFLERGESWNYQQDGTAYYLTFTADYSYSEKERYNIQKNGTIAEGVPVLDVVQGFLENLDEGKFKKAFDLQNNSDWGDFSKFSSTSSFGGIIQVNQDSLKILSQTNNSAEIYCEAIYFDTINGNSQIKQKFTLSKNNSEWKITKMKVLEFESIAQYSCDEFNYSLLKLSKITSEGFDFSLFVVSDQPEENYDNKYAGEISGHADFVSPEHAIFEEGKSGLDFNFDGKTKINILEIDACTEYRSKDISFDGIFNQNYYFDVMY